LRAEKLTSAADKPFEGISKVVCECINHSQLDNMNGYRTDEDFCEQMAQPFEEPKILTLNNEIE